MVLKFSRLLISGERFVLFMIRTGINLRVVCLYKPAAAWSIQINHKNKGYHILSYCEQLPVGKPIIICGRGFHVAGVE
jgi:hypothetical protein